MASSSNYWLKRQKQLQAITDQVQEQSLKRIEKEYKRVQREIETQLQAFDARYGSDINTALLRADKNDKQFLYDDWVSFLSNHDEYPYDPEEILKFKRLEALQSEIQLKLAEFQYTQDEIVRECLSNVSRETYDFIATSAKTEVTGMSDEMLRLFLDKRWANNENFSDRIWANTQKLTNYIHTDLKNNIMLGKPYKETTKQLQDRFNVGFANSKRLVYTESAYIQNETTFQVYKEIGIKRYTFIAAKDQRTSDTCMSLNNKTFYLKDAVTGMNKPPMHPYCRSTTVPEID